MIYHIFNKSIANFVIFNTDFEYSRMRKMIRYYQIEKRLTSFSRFIESREEINGKHILDCGLVKNVDVVAYCIMPTHFHLLLNVLEEINISSFVNNILNSYSRYFNIKHGRKGPLWQGRFKKVLVKNDEQLLHLTRYIHLNPATAYLVDKPEHWIYSSYMEYLNANRDNADNICNYSDLVTIKPNAYRMFVEDRIDYQRELAKIKELLLE